MPSNDAALTAYVGVSAAVRKARKKFMTSKTHTVRAAGSCRDWSHGRLGNVELAYGDMFLILEGPDSGIFTMRGLDPGDGLGRTISRVGDRVAVDEGNGAQTCFIKTGWEKWEQYVPEDVTIDTKQKFDMTGNTEPCDRMEGIGD